MGSGETLHASCVVIGEGGILIRGESGLGKSTLARELVHGARRAGRFARLVSDDRTHIAPHHERLVARPVEAIAGLIEIRGLGIVPVRNEPGAVIRLVVDLTMEEPTRLPEREECRTSLCGIVLPRLRQRMGPALVSLVLGGGSGFHDTLMTQ